MQRKQIIIHCTTQEHAALKTDAKEHGRTLGAHTLFLALNTPSVSEKLSALMSSKGRSGNPLRLRKGERI